MDLVKSASLRIARVRERIVGPKLRPRRYLETESLIEFFCYLNKSSVSYVILRWFDDLPTLAKGEDLDLIIQDDETRYFNGLALFNKGGLVPFDVYSVSGLKGTAYRNSIPYFAPKLSKQILHRRQLYKEHFFVPCFSDHLMSFLYHCVFHKGLKAGLEPGVVLKPDLLASERKRVGKDYLGEIKRLAIRASTDLPGFDLASLTCFLRSTNWVPDRRSVKVLCRYNPWVQIAIKNGLL